MRERKERWIIPTTNKYLRVAHGRRHVRVRRPSDSGSPYSVLGTSRKYPNRLRTAPTSGEWKRLCYMVSPWPTMSHSRVSATPIVCSSLRRRSSGRLRRLLCLVYFASMESTQSLAFSLAISATLSFPPFLSLFPL